jgi:hypothetical protein
LLGCHFNIHGYFAMIRYQFFYIIHHHWIRTWRAKSHQCRPR